MCPRANALRQEKPPQREAHPVQSESSPRFLQLENTHAQQQRALRAAMKTQCSQKKKKNLRAF